MTLILHDISGTEILVNWAQVKSAATWNDGSVLTMGDGQDGMVLVQETLTQIATVVGAVVVP